MKDWTHNLLPDAAQQELIQELMFAVEDDRQRARDPIADARHRFIHGCSLDKAIARVKRLWPEYFRAEA